MSSQSDPQSAETGAAVSSGQPLASTVTNNDNFFRSMFNSAGIAIALTDARGLLTHANDAWLRLLGYRSEDVLGRSPADFTHPDDREESAHMVRALLCGEITTYRIAKRYLRKDGSPCWVDLSGSAIHDDDQGITGTVALCADITERKETERALRDNQQLMVGLLGSTQEGFWFINNEGQTVDVNPAMCALLGRPREQILGRTIFDFVDEENADIFRCEMRARKRGKTGHYEIALSRPDGTTVVCLNNATPLFNSDGDRVGSVGLWADITAIKKAQRELERAKDEAQAANQAKSAFLATMSHEIRTPLNGVVSIIDILGVGDLRPEQRFQLELGRQAADQLLSVIGNVLDMSKLEAGQLKLETVPFDLAALIETASATFAVDAARKGLELVVDCDACDHLMLGDPTRLKQIVLNLIGNAVKFTQSGEVVIRAAAFAQADVFDLRISVSDSGIGIPSEALPRLTEKFVQASVATARQFGGSGLGLSICKQLAEMMNGSLRITSEPGRGSTFIVTLTLPKGPKIDLEALRSGRAQTVVVASRNAAVCGASARLAAAAGYRPIVVHDIERIVLQLRTLTATGMDGIVLLDESACDRNLLDSVAHVRASASATDRIIVMARPTIDAGLANELAGQVSTIVLKPLTQAKLRKVLSMGSVRADRSASESTPQAPDLPAVERTVLVAEDNGTNRYVALQMLKQLGWVARAATDGLEAVHIAAQVKFDAILMDVDMPNLDGLAATQAIRQGQGPNRNTPIIAFTANAFIDDIRRCLEAGMNGHLAKPIKRDVLAQALDKFSGGASPAPSGESA